MKKLAYIVLFLQLSFSANAFAQQDFVVRSIEVEGLHRLSSQTVYSKLPFKRGDTLTQAKASATIRALYQTGLFEQVNLHRDGNTLIIRVSERSVIGQLKISGNSLIPTDKLKPVLLSMDIAEGRIYNAASLEKIKLGLLSQYYQLGRYNARVDIKVTPLPRQRVLVNVEISEGLVAKVRGINIIGNHAFHTKKLINQMDLRTPGIISLITQTDRYSDEKMESSIEKLRNYYLDRGYVQFQIKSSQAEVTPDRKAVYVTIVINEGAVYRVGEVTVSGEFPVPREDVQKLVRIKRGSIFSRQAVVETQKIINKLYGSKGYLFAMIGVKPAVDEASKTISLTFDIQSGKKTYVRKISFSENQRTNEKVLRREVQQLEAAPASSVRLDESKQRLQLLPYIKQADMAINPVAGKDDQVDVDYKVKEDSATTASLKLGYSQLYHLVLGASFNQKNFLGTGEIFGMNLTQSRFQQLFAVDFTNPYYTEDGISRSFNFSLSRIDPKGAGLSRAYTANEMNFGVSFGIPIGQEAGAFSRLFVGMNYEDTVLHLNHDSRFNIPTQISQFVNNHGRHYQELDFKMGAVRDSRDRALFPTRGTVQTLYLDAYAPIAQGVAFYSLNYAGKAFYPLTEQFILTGKANLGYGNGFKGLQDFPFFKNYHAGGIDSVHGYYGLTLGPRDSNHDPFGGNMLATASVGLIFPNYISDSLRTSIFVDGGNAWLGENNREFGGNSTNAGPPRYSTGIQADILTPFGPISLSLAKPLNAHKGDDLEYFQLSFGANF